MTDDAADQTPHPRPKPRAGLGRGLNALMGDIAREEPVRGGEAALSSGVRTLPVGSLTPHPGQPRRHFSRSGAGGTGRVDRGARA